MMPYQTNSPDTNTEWLTPPGIIEALGKFDLDPCTPHDMPWPTARHRYTVTDDGLLQPWHGRVWLNPPYGPFAGDWLVKMREHNNGIALVPARTETRMFFDSVWGYAAGVCFIKGRLKFHYPDGTQARQTTNAPLCLIAYGRRNLDALRRCGLGAVVVGDGRKG